MKKFLLSLASLVLCFTFQVCFSQSHKISIPEFNNEHHRNTTFEGVIAYYPFNGNTNDESGNNYNATNHNAVLTTGVTDNPDHAYQFNGISSYMDIPDFSLLGLGHVTVHTWLYIENTNNSVAIYKTKLGELYICTNNNMVIFGVKLTDSQWYEISCTANAMGWYCVTGTWERGNEIKLYLNAIQSAQATVPDLELYTENNHISSIGSYSGFVYPDEARPFKGKIDEVQFYNRLLTQSEIMFLYTSIWPVELISFISSINNNNAELKWVTSFEENNFGFEVERNSDSDKDWKKAGFVYGNGTSNENKSFLFTDRNLPSGKYNYRLKQIDYNGNYKYYNLTEDIWINLPQKFYLSQNYPNPFNPVTKINFNLPSSSKVTIKIFNALGKEIAFVVKDEILNPGYYTKEFDAGILSSGVYFYQIKVEGEKLFLQTKKMLLLK